MVVTDTAVFSKILILINEKEKSIMKRQDNSNNIFFNILYIKQPLL